MRDTTVLRRLLAIPEVRVVGVELTAEGLIVDVRLRRATRARCPRCAFTTRSTYDRRPARLWRHLDLGGRRCWLRMPLRRLVCPDHGVVTEAVPFAPTHWSTKVGGKTVTRHLSDEEGRLYVEWIANRRRVREILRRIERVSAKAAATAVQAPERSRSRAARSRS